MILTRCYYQAPNGDRCILGHLFAKYGATGAELEALGGEAIEDIYKQTAQPLPHWLEAVFQEYTLDTLHSVQVANDNADQDDVYLRELRDFALEAGLIDENETLTSDY